MKQCFKCKADKPLADFYRHKDMADGHLNKCKECTRLDVAEHISLKKSDPKWLLKERERCRIKARGEMRKSRPEQMALRSRNYDRRHPQKRKAQYAVGNAIRDGKLFKQPCEKCFNPKAQAHHDDYNKPLEVRWLCVKHHNEHHVKERESKLLIHQLEHESTI